MEEVRQCIMNRPDNYELITNSERILAPSVRRVRKEFVIPEASNQIFFMSKYLINSMLVSKLVRKTGGRAKLTIRGAFRYWGMFVTKSTKLRTQV